MKQADKRVATPIEYIDLKSFVAKHPFAVYTVKGKYHSRYASPECGAHTVVNGMKGGWMEDERNERAYNYQECCALVYRSPQPVQPRIV